MHPARSVILFTTASGAGYGLLAWLAVLAPFGALPDGVGFVIAAFGVALGLIIVGLLASTVHLGHPERAWRALSQWRSSWLSREGLAAVATFVPAGLFAAAALALGFAHPATVVAGLLAAAGAAATVTSTAMIYASLRAVPAWANGWTVAGYLVFAAMTGAVLAHALARLWGAPGANVLAWAALALGLAGFAVKAGYWQRIDGAEPASTPETATGLGPLGRVRLLEAPHTAPNYLMREMGFEIARRHAARLRRAAMVLGFFAPSGLALIAGVAGASTALAASLAAVASAGIGIAIERWLFFAEARHVVMLYYGRR